MKGTKIAQVEKQVKDIVNSKDHNDVFASYFNNEYNDNQIGDLEGEDGLLPLNLNEDEAE